MKRFTVEIDTRDPDAGVITPGLLSDQIQQVLDAHGISYGRIDVHPGPDPKFGELGEDLAAALIPDDVPKGAQIGDVFIVRRDEPIQYPRPVGECPRGTPGCHYADCSDSPGHACYGANAPEHVDRGL